MLFIIEIILTIVAWVRGWSWKALIPIGSALVLGFIIGFFIVAAGGQITAAVAGLVAILDFIAFTAILVMAIVKPTSVKEAEAEESKRTEVK